MDTFQLEGAIVGQSSVAIIPERTFQIFFVFLFLSIQSFFKESILIGFVNATKYLKLEWDSSVMTQAQVGFFLLHVVMQIPAGMKAEKHGGKIVMQLAMFFCSVISFLTPISFLVKRKEFFIIFVSLQGLGEGCFIPVFYVFTSQWVPLQERSKLFSAAFGGTIGSTLNRVVVLTFQDLRKTKPKVTIRFEVWSEPRKVFLGMHFGSLVGIPIIKLITDRWWYSGFVLSAFLGFLWVIMSIFFVRLWRPRKRISMRSRRNLQLVFGRIRISETGATLNVPWAKILTSLPFWSTMFCHFGAVWSCSIFLRDLSYFTSLYEILMDPEFMTQPFMISLIAIVVFVIFIEVLKYFKITRQNRRKIMNSICLWGTSLMLVVLAVSTHYDYHFETAVFMIGAACTSASYTGVYINHAELSPIFAGTLMGISNVVGNSANIVKPIIRYIMVVDQEIQKQESKAQWAAYFAVSAAILFFTNVPFLLYGTCKEQLWYLPQEMDEEFYNEFDSEPTSSKNTEGKTDKKASRQADVGAVTKIS